MLNELDSLPGFQNKNISINDESKTKKSILEKISDILSKPSGIKSSVIFNKLYEREKLGSTSIGKGVAIPHARVKDIEYPFVSIIVPENNFNDHLELLAQLSKKLDNPEIRKALRKARNSKQIISNLSSDNLEFI